MTCNFVGTFYICPTPIGNLEDVSTRVLETLKNVDLIYCEDTRRAKKLLDHFKIKTPVSSYFLGNEHKKINEIESLLQEGKHIALISDAGTPLISDPGSELISYLVSKKNKIISIPGPSSILVALTISGFDLSEFQFLGFIPKAGKEKIDFVLKLLNSTMTSVCFTSPKRISKDLSFFDDHGLNSQIVVCRELTKKFETIYRGSIQEVKEHLLDKQLKGELTLVIAPSEKEEIVNFDLDTSLKVFIENEVPKREIAKAVSNITSYSANDIYDRIKDL